jgi:hypothetical protein
VSNNCVCSDIDEPILFRTMNAKVYGQTLADGSLWLRSDKFYREIEDAARRDESEGINAARLGVHLTFAVPSGPLVNVRGTGRIGQLIVPHYILSLHGSSISEGQLESFGGHTLGIKSLTRLSAEVLYRCSLTGLTCRGYRFGPVSYRHSVLSQSRTQQGSAAICLAQQPPLYLNPSSTDVLQKEPVAPFIEQDEWRVVVFTDGYLDGDPNLPLKINVEPSNFYPYQEREGINELARSARLGPAD